MLLHELRNFEVDRLDVDEMVGLLAVAQLVRNEYEKVAMDEPEWVNDKIKLLKREIRAKNAEKLAARAKEINARLETLKTPTQKKSELQKELKRVQEQLGEEVGSL